MTAAPVNLSNSFSPMVLYSCLLPLQVKVAGQCFTSVGALLAGWYLH